MKLFFIELQKEKRIGIVPLMFLVGILGAGYAFINFMLRKDTLLNLPLAPMDILLTQSYGMIVIFNMFGMITAACIIYHMEFKGNAMKKMYILPMSSTAMYGCKFGILTGLFLAAVCFQSTALTIIGKIWLPQDAFAMKPLISFTGYSVVTSMPVLGIMLIAAFHFENLWIPLGIGVAGFLSGMALSVSDTAVFLLHPFVIMLKPVVAMSAKPDRTVISIALGETIVFLGMGLLYAKKRYCE